MYNIFFVMRPCINFSRLNISEIVVFLSLYALHYKIHDPVAACKMKIKQFF